SLTPPPLDETQNAPPLGLREMPQAFFRVGSWSWATPGRSDTRLVCRKFAAIRLRSSSASSASRARAGFRADVLPGRPLPRNNFDTRFSPNTKNLLRGDGVCEPVTVGPWRPRLWRPPPGRERDRGSPGAAARRAPRFGSVSGGGVHGRRGSGFSPPGA